MKQHEMVSLLHRWTHGEHGPIEPIDTIFQAQEMVEGMAADGYALVRVADVVAALAGHQLIAQPGTYQHLVDGDHLASPEEFAADILGMSAVGSARELSRNVP